MILLCRPPVTWTCHVDSGLELLDLTLPHGCGLNHMTSCPVKFSVFNDGNSWAYKHLKHFELGRTLLQRCSSSPVRPHNDIYPMTFPNMMLPDMVTVPVQRVLTIFLRRPQEDHVSRDPLVLGNERKLVIMDSLGRGVSRG